MTTIDLSYLHSLSQQSSQFHNVSLYVCNTIIYLTSNTFQFCIEFILISVCQLFSVRFSSSSAIYSFLFMQLKKIGSHSSVTLWFIFLVSFFFFSLSYHKLVLFLLAKMCMCILSLLPNTYTNKITKFEIYTQKKNNNCIFCNW